MRLLFKKTQEVMCSGVFEVSLLRLQNHRGVTGTGRCCRGPSSFPPCDGECRTFITACILHHIQTLPVPRRCTYGEARSAVVGGNAIDLDDQEPVTFTINIDFTWPGEVTVIVESWHDVDGTATIYDSSQLITQTYVATSVPSSDTWHMETTITPTTEQKIRFRFTCNKHYFGIGCDVLCRIRDDQYGHYHCDVNGTRVCKPGWSGDYCDKHHVSNYTCVCPPGFGGNNCKFPLCYPGFCFHGGECQTRDGARECSCMENYAGDRCEHQLVPCEMIKCQHGGSCVPGRYGGTCVCTEKYTGERCEEEIDPCISTPCNNGAECRKDNGTMTGFTCLCETGFGGSLCDIPISPCAGFRCYNGGKCLLDPEGNPKCACKSGHIGEHCEISTDPCKGVKCLNSGSCKALGNGFTCVCAKGYHGEVCELKLNACDSTPCLNLGVCKDYVSSFLCICPKHFSGDNCETDLREGGLDAPPQNDEKAPPVGDNPPVVPAVSGAQTHATRVQPIVTLALILYVLMSLVT
ncbi:DLL1-like protein [Mya arenaria]|uniref:Delta-like protein n=1 Tax=Mya arenaria TaxID=6604 RepID=A0ABY7DVC5_MYAAR|nr:DLL1-like protein [Mya arenaria]